MSKIHDIVAVEVLPPFGLRVIFDDGEARELNLADQLAGTVFEPLRDPAEFARVEVDTEAGTVAWPTGADLDPIVIYRSLPPLMASKVEAPARA